MQQTEFATPYPFNTAVLFLVFNRLDTTKQVFEAIKEAKPPRLYIAADGARASKEGEAEKVSAVRDFILQNIDWDCEVKTLFRDENLGCKYAVSGAIDWFFKQEEMGIILEDDCLPSQSFFWFCEELLERYKGDMRVWNVGGYKHSYLKGNNYSYNFSRFTQIWGWASWANRWKYYDVSLLKYKDNKNLLSDYEFFREDYENASREKTLDSVLNGNIDTWDYQWNFTVRINSGLSIRPSVNLIGNVGFGEEATHTLSKNDEVEKNIADNIKLPLNHPDFIMVYKIDDQLFGKNNLDNRLLSRVKRKING
jgi:hypothetical protein